MKTKPCSTCKLDKPISEFGNNKSKPDGKQYYCKECGKLSDKNFYASSVKRKSQVTKSRLEAKNRNRELIIAYLLQNPCVDCGEADPFFLEFDHVQGEKYLEVSTMARSGWGVGKLQEEIEKCVVRCVKCHKIATAKRGGWYEEHQQLVNNAKLR